ncbi:4735_t:CDS:2, partial [Gigaspora rosea]
VPNNDDKNNMYYTAINTVENIQKRDEYAHNDPLWWGILDFRDDNISPCPDSLRAENFLSEGEINRFINALKGAINEEKEKISKSAESFIEALLLSDIISIYQLSKVFGTYGVSGLCNLLQKSAEEMQDNEKKGFKLTLEISMFTMMKLFIDKWVTCFAGECQSERTVDMFVVGPYAKTPHTVFLYGENRSDADREDKANRSGANCVGKACDFLYRNSSRETGVGENSGPTHKDNHDKSVTNFIEVIKVAKSQHKKLQNHIIEQCGNKTLPKNLQNELESIFIPFFQIIGMKIRFYLLFQINGDLYGIWDWASEIIPTNDEDIGEAVLLCRTFLIHSNFVARAERMTNILSKRAKVYKLRHPEEFTPRSIKLNQLQTPNKKNNRKERENGHNNDV